MFGNLTRIALLAGLLGLTSCAHQAHVHDHGHFHGDTTISVPDLATHHDDEKPWTSLEALDSEDGFHFVVVTDRTGGHREGVFPIGLDAINRVQPAFVISVGDIVEGYTLDKDIINGEWDDMEGKIGKLDAPFFYVAGNHDMMNAEMEEIWTERFGASYYHFRYKNTLFVILNSEFFDTPDYNAHMPEDDPIGMLAWKTSEKQARQREEQIAYLETVLKENEDVRWTFLFMHKPYWRENWVQPPRDEEGEFVLDEYPVEGPWPRKQPNIPDWQRIAPLLADRNYTFFAGHNHSYEYEDASDGKHTHDHIAMATMGGASSLRGLTYGEFDHFMWVTMTEDGPVFANLMMEGVQPKDLNVPDARPYWVD